jgi:hypothetical protein
MERKQLYRIFNRLFYSMQRFSNSTCQDMLYIQSMKKYLSLFVFLIFIFSCSKKQTTADPFDENVKIKMVEGIDSTKKTLTLRCFTEKIFTCSNYYISHTISVTANKIAINFIEINEPGICLTSLGPASAIIDLINLDNRDYELEIKISNTTITGQLKVSNGSYQAILPVQNRVQFVNTTLNRVPNNAIWGTVHYHASATVPIVQNFIDSLQLLGALSSTYIPGDYTEFQIEPNGQIKQTQDGGYYFTRYFIYNYPGSSLPLKTLIRNFGINHPSLLLITLNTTKGETFRSCVP